MERVKVTSFATQNLSIAEDGGGTWSLVDSNGDEFHFTVTELSEMLQLAEAVTTELEFRSNSEEDDI